MDPREVEIRRLTQEEFQALTSHLKFLREHFPLIEMLVEVWRPEHRHILSLGLSGLLRKGGIPKEYAERLIRAICILAKDSEINDRLRAVEDTYRKPLEEIAGVSVLAKELERVAGSDLSRRILSLLPLQKKVEDKFSQVFDIISSRIISLFIEEREMRPYAALSLNEGVGNYPLDGEEFKGLLNLFYFETSGRGIREEIKNNIVSTLEAKALKEGKRKILELLAFVDEERRKIWVDTGSPNWDMIEITAEGWRKVQSEGENPFRRTKLTALLEAEEVEPTPEMCRELLLFLLPPSVNDEVKNDFSIFFPPYVCCLLLTHIPRPGLFYTGPHGAAKSFSQRLILKLFTKGDVQGLGGDEKDLAVRLQAAPIVALDNVVRLSEEEAALLSAAITGATYQSRRLYTDRELEVIKLRRVVLINGINPSIASFPDLMDRFVVVSLGRLDGRKREEERELEKNFQEIRPLLLAAIFTSLSRAFIHLDEVRKEFREKGLYPRMADFAVWGEAVARGMGYKPLEWFNAYARLMEETQAIVLDENPLGKAVLELTEKLRNLEGGDPERAEREGELPAEGKGRWIGTPTQLLKRLEELLIEKEGNLEGALREGFPRTACWLGRELRKLLPNLQDRGISITFRNGGRTGRNESWMLN